MAQIIGLPKLSPTMEEGVLVRWTKKEGDKVSPGDLVAEVETDKANMDFNIEDEGVLLKFLVKEGDTVKLGAPVAIIGKAGEDIAALIEQARAAGGAASTTAPPPPPPPGAAKPAAPAARQPLREVPRPEQEPAGKAAAQPAAPARPAPPASPPAGPAQPVSTPPAKHPQPTQPPAAPGGRLLASPLAKTLAIELGIDLRQVTGTGPGGRIVERDVRAAAEADQHNGRAAAAAEAPATEAAPAAEVAAPATALVVRQARPGAEDSEADWTDAPASSMRKRIATRMTEAKRDVPHIYLMRELDAAPLLAYRERLNQLVGDRIKISVNDLVVKAVALALRRMPECNASWQGDAIRQFHRVHIGVAVAIPEGLVTPVVRDADAKGIGSIAAEIKDLADRARKRALKVHEIQGSTFSVSNLGMYGIERFTAIINPPEAGILAVGAARDVAVVDKGSVVAGKRMTVSMSCDHRVIDGALGARWLTVLAELIEKPESLAL
jgi:pyruvate dehydrogenase E2 component (dihydrolipoamide acetyltransferase)